MPATPTESRRPRRRLVVSVLGVTVAGAMNVVGIASLVALVFASVGRSTLADGLGLALVGTVVTTVWIALRTSLPGAQAAPQSIVAVIVAVAVSDAVSRAAPGTEGSTALVVVVVSGLLIGVVTLILGSIGAARLMRYLPHPVVAGVLAAGGWLLVTSAISMMSGHVDVAASARSTVTHWVPGLAIGIAIFIAGRILAHPLVVPIGVAGATAGFYGVAALAGVGIEQLARDGWLFGPLPEGGLLRLPPVDAFWAADWGAVVAQAPTLAAAAFATALLVVIFTNAMELEHGVDMVPQRELRATGAATLLGAVFAGMPSSISPTETQLARTMQVRRRSDAALTGLIPLIVLVLGAGLLEAFPRPVLGGVLVHLGLKDLGTHLFPGFRRYARSDLLVVLLIVLTVAVLGVLPGIGVGMAAAVVIFVVATAGEDVLGEARAGTTVRSRVTRSAPARDALAKHGERTVVYHLAGTVFFGTADKLTTAVRHRLEDDPTPWSIVLDVAGAGTFDATGSLAVARIARATTRVGADLFVVGAGPNVRAAMGWSRSTVHFVDDLDRALERCEDRVLDEVGLAGARASFDDALDRISGGRSTWSELRAWFDEVDVDAGAVLIEQGGEADAFWLLAEGRVSAFLLRDGSAAVRLESLVPGQAIGELGFVTQEPRSARIVADDSSLLYRMDREGWQRLREERPDLALALRDLLLRLVSERVQQLSGAVAEARE